PRSTVEQVQSEGGYGTAHVARDVVMSASSQQVPAAASGHEWHQELSDNAESAVAQSTARKAIAPHLVDSGSASQPRSTVEQGPSEEGYGTAHVARDVVMSASSQQVPAAASGHEWHQELSDNAESVVAQSTARKAIAPHLVDSGSASQPRSTVEQGPSEEGYGTAHVARGYGTAHVARDVVMSASSQQKPAAVSGHEWHQELSDNAESVVAQSTARNAIAPHLADSGSASQPRSTVEQELSDNTESGAAQSIARQAIAPHLADSGSASQPRSTVEQVQSEGGYGTAHVARDVVMSASSQQLPAAASGHEWHQELSDNEESVVAQSTARKAIAPHLADSGSASQPKSTVEQGPSEEGYVTAQVARDVVMSASSQQAAAAVSGDDRPL
ncbi:unnamed protein product, partial [Effrenium voratum]